MSPVVTIGLRDTKAHFSRFVMSIIAIALGVAFVLGSFCFRGLLNRQVDAMFATNADADVYVRGDIPTSRIADSADSSPGTDSSSDVSASASSASTSASSSSSADSDDESYNNIEVSLVGTINAVDGVSQAVLARSLDGVVLVDSDGVATPTMGGTSTLGMSESQPWRSAHFTQGTYPHGIHEVALSADTAEAAGLSYGDTTKVVYPSSGVTDVTVSGVFDLDSSEAGGLILGIDPDVVDSELQAQGTDTDVISRIRVYGDANGGQPLTEDQQRQLADAINAALSDDSDATAVTGDAYRDKLSSSTKKQLGFIQPLILIFAVIALFVGSFIIANTFSMIVRESMRGYALQRSIGISPAQVSVTVVIQALALGVAGSGIGILLGWGVVELIVAALAAQGTPLDASAAPSASSIVVALAVGVVVSLLGAALPARRAALAPPIQAMNETANPEKPTWPRAVEGVAMIALGAVCWRFAVLVANADNLDLGPSSWPWLNHLGVGWPLGVGAAFVVIGVIVLAPALVSPVAAVLGWIPSHVFPVTGRLAVRNLGRQKRRTANTAAALFVGLAIVSCIGVVTASIKTSVSDIVDNNLRSDYLLSSQSMRLPDAAIDDVRALDDVQDVTARSQAVGITVNHDDSIPVMTFVVSRDFADDVVSPDSWEGDFYGALDSDSMIVVGKSLAQKYDWHVGDAITLTSDGVTMKAAEQMNQSDSTGVSGSDDSESQTPDYATMSSEDLQAQMLARFQQAAAGGDDSASAQLAAFQQLQQAAAAGDSAASAQLDRQVEQYRQAMARSVEEAKRKALDDAKASSRTEKYTIGAIAKGTPWGFGLWINADQAGQLGETDALITSVAFVKFKDGTDLDAARGELESIAKPYYTISVMSRDEYTNTMSSMIDQVMIILYALLALSVVIAVFGIVNTLTLSIFERTREIGILRAVGMSDGQVRGMIAIESTLISLMGTVLGLVVGVAAGYEIQRCYAPVGMSSLTVPWAQLVLFLAVSVVVGVLASFPPARRALRVPVLDAVVVD